MVVSMIVADNLAAHALGGFFCNFGTVKRFCRFCNCTKDQLAANIKIKCHFKLRKFTITVSNSLSRILNFLQYMA